MGRSFRERFEREKAKIGDLEGAEFRSALRAFTDALDPEFHHEMIPKPTPAGGVERSQPTNSSAENYLSKMRILHERGLDVLEADADTVNTFMLDMVSEPEDRRSEMVDFAGTISKPSARTYQSAARAFYRYFDEPGAGDDRRNVNVSWPAKEIVIFRDESDPQHDEEDMPEQPDLDAMREACLQSQNTRRDRAFVELAAGTGQRLYALLTLRVRDISLDAEIPHIMLNPAIDGDGDKRAIELTGRWKPIVTDIGPIKQWKENHWLRDPDIRAEYGAPEDFRDCYLFVGDPNQADTDPSSHWDRTAAASMLERRKANTADISSVKTVEIPVNPHNWRHHAYTQSQDLPIDESIRRKVFGWASGSDTGQTIYGHKENMDAGKKFAGAWAEAFDDADSESVRTAIAGDVAGADELPPALRQQLIEDLLDDERFVERIQQRLDA